MRRSLVAGLERLGCEVYQAGSVTGALRELSERPIDVIVLDIKLRRRSGVEVAEHACALKPAPAIIAVTAAATEEESFRLGQIGVRAFVRKSELEDRFEELLALARRPTPLQPHVATQVGHENLLSTVDGVRSEMVEQAIARAGGDKSLAAKMLGVPRQTVYYAMKKLGLGGNPDEG